MNVLKLIDHLNAYFGTEFVNANQFVKDFTKGDLSEDYDTDEGKLQSLLMFIQSASKHI